jgi:hypothetical protein
VAPDSSWTKRLKRVFMREILLLPQLSGDQELPGPLGTLPTIPASSCGSVK